METGKVVGKRETVCIVAPAYYTVGGMGSIIRQLIRVLDRNQNVAVLSVKWLEEKKRTYAHYNIALHSKLKLLFTPWHLPTIFLYLFAGSLWCFVLNLAGVKKFLVQEAIVSAFFVTLVGKMMGARSYVFDYGPMLNLYDPGLMKRGSKYQRGLLRVAYFKLLKMLNRFTLRHCSRFFVHSKKIMKCALDHGLSKDRIVFYTFPIDTTIFHPYKDVETERIRKRFGFGKHEVVVTFVGRISEDKGLPELMESMKRLVEKHGAQVRFVAAGKGPLVDWFVESISGFGERAQFLGPLHDRKQVAELLNASDVFVYPITVSYGVALATLEAMAVGTPVVMTNVGPTKELIVNGHNGMVVPVGDVESLTNALERLVKDEELREHMGKNARKVVARFSLEAYERTILSNIA